MFQVEVFWLVTRYPHLQGETLVSYHNTSPWRWGQHGPLKLWYPTTTLHPEDGGSMDLWNVGILPRHYTVSQPRTRIFTVKTSELTTQVEATNKNSVAWQNRKGKKREVKMNLGQTSKQQILVREKDNDDNGNDKRTEECKVPEETNRSSMQLILRVRNKIFSYKICTVPTHTHTYIHKRARVCTDARNGMLNYKQTMILILSSHLRLGLPSGLVT
jgi:hypothetical protein